MDVYSISSIIMDVGEGCEGMDGSFTIWPLFMIGLAGLGLVALISFGGLMYLIGKKR